MSHVLSMTQGRRGQIEVMSHGWRGHHSDVTWTQCDTRTEVTHPCGVTQTHGDTRTEGTDSSAVTWTHCGTRTSHGCHCDVTWWHEDRGDRLK